MSFEVLEKPFFTNTHLEQYSDLIYSKNEVEKNLDTLYETILDLDQNKRKYFSKKDVEVALKKNVKLIERNEKNIIKSYMRDQDKRIKTALRDQEKSLKVAEKEKEKNLKMITRKEEKDVKLAEREKEKNLKMASREEEKKLKFLRREEQKNLKKECTQLKKELAFNSKQYDVSINTAEKYTKLGHSNIAKIQTNISKNFLKNYNFIKDTIEEKCETDE